MFSNHKKVFLSKLDKSSKGSVDEGIKQLVNEINADERYYTTSSCSGRVVLRRGDKKSGSWLAVSHDLIDREFFLVDYPCWLRVEPLIIHVCCRDLESASALLDRFKLKKSSILSLRRKIVVEIKGSEGMVIPLRDVPSDWLIGEVNRVMREIME
jgi:tRNA wybutosine-synthesizing protein 3